MANVLLLREPTQGSPDKYEATFQAQGFNPISVPVLETSPVNVSELKRIISRGPTKENLGGVVITSARSVEVWKLAVDILLQEVAESEYADWAQVPFYVVGSATAKALEGLSSHSDGSPYAPGNILGGEQSGTGEKLAHYILEHNQGKAQKPTLLYLTGDKNRDTIPNILHAGGISLRPLQVYETKGSRTFSGDLNASLAKCSSGNWWIVFFAPSSADFVTPTLRTRFNLPWLESMADGTKKTKIAAIGATTSTFLTETLKLRVDAVASKPSPEGLVGAIRATESFE